MKRLTIAFCIVAFLRGHNSLSRGIASCWQNSYSEVRNAKYDSRHPCRGMSTKSDASLQPLDHDLDYVKHYGEYGKFEDTTEGFDMQLELTRRVLDSPGLASVLLDGAPEVQTPLGLFDFAKIMVNNAMQMVGIAESIDGAPLVQGVNSFKGSKRKLLARLADGNLQDLVGRPLFLLLHEYYEEFGPIFKLAFGPKSFMVVSDPTMVKHILRENAQNYNKGILAEILEPIMGKGLIPADPETWKVRRRAIVPGFHKAWLNAMMALIVDCNKPLLEKLDAAADIGAPLNMEAEFGSVSLDIIGKAVFNYEFGSVTKESPVVKAVYRALKEAEYRSTCFVPYWNIPFAKYFMKNLQDFQMNIGILNSVLDDLISKALESRETQDLEDLETRDYSKMENPSLLRFLVDMRGEESTSVQLRDDLMTMLIAGHETTAAVLTWTFFELCQQPELMSRVQKEIDEVLQGSDPQHGDVANLPLIRLCLAETLRMYPEPPLLIRRALEDDVLPKGGAMSKTHIPKGTDIFIATWNIHRSEKFWVEPNTYNPDRFSSDFSNPSEPAWGGYSVGGGNQLYPNEIHSDFAFLPFGGGTRKCVGDQFAMMESCATVALILQRYDVALATPASAVGIATGATIHTQNGLSLSFKKRQTFSELSHKVKIIAAATSIPSPLPSTLETPPMPPHCAAKFTVQAHDKIELQIPHGIVPLEGRTESKSKCPMSGA